MPATQKTASKGGRSADRVYEYVRSEILDGTLAPGDRLLEEALAERLGVSRTPVREAIARLEAERLVERAPRVGLIVPTISRNEIEDIYAVREVLEGLAARLCARTASTSERRQLEYLEIEMAEAIDAHELEAVYQLNLEFHREIVHASRNDALISYLEQIHTAIRRFGPTTMSDPERAAQAMAEHRRLVEAINDKDEDRAEELARQHIANARDVRILMHTRRRRERETPRT